MQPRKLEGFLRTIAQQSTRGGFVVALTGDVDGLLYSEELGGYDSLEALLVAELSSVCHLLAVDINRIDFLSEGDMADYARSLRGKHPIEQKHQGVFGKMFREAVAASAPPTVEDLVKRVTDSDYLPLQNLALLRTLCEVREGQQSGGDSDKPLLIVVRDAAVMFPEKPAAELLLDQAQRLQAFLNWVRSKDFVEGPHLVLLVNPTLSDLSLKIRQLTNFSHIATPLPTTDERLRYIKWHLANELKAVSTLDPKTVAKLTSGLPFAAIRDLHLTAAAEERPLTQGDITSAINRELKAKLGDIASFELPRHGPEAVVGYEGVKSALTEVFDDCNDSATAHSMVLLTGPNGGGKTFIFQAMAQASGRVVLRLSKIRDTGYGNTEKFWERFRFIASCYDNLCVVMDEADTQLGNVNSKQTHDVDNRLTGSILDVASDQAFRGRLIWVLLTARPNNLSSDIVSRCTAVVPVFDLDGEEREQFVITLFAKSGIELSSESEQVFEKTKGFSNRDFDGLVRKVTSRRRRDKTTTVEQVLATWAPGEAILLRRQYQELLAAEHSTFPQLIPERIKKLTKDEREQLKAMMELTF